MPSETNPFAPTPEARARVAQLRRRLALPGLRAAVLGAGKSGRAAAALLSARGATVVVLDDKDPNARITSEVLESVELVVLSPGVPRTRPEIQASIARGEVVGEIELASWFVKAPLIGITGTNGKSTTTALIAHVFETAGLRTFAGGNLGRPLSELALSGEVVDVAVVELSSYQLESLVDARFRVACWLNLSPDHADRYVDLAAYAAAKARLLECRAQDGVAVLNADDPHLRALGPSLAGPVRWFSTAEFISAGTASEARSVAERHGDGSAEFISAGAPRTASEARSVAERHGDGSAEFISAGAPRTASEARSVAERHGDGSAEFISAGAPRTASEARSVAERHGDRSAEFISAGVPRGTHVVGKDLATRAGAEGEERYDLTNEVLVGVHNRANMCAAIECVRPLGVAPALVERGLQSFRGLPHRIELVRVLDGVRWLNDSKATNVDSAVIALSAVEGPKILIAGGKDKGAPWDPLVERARSQVKAVLAIGAASAIVERAFTGAVERVEAVETLERAVARAQALAEPGDAVLLSPACASFDQFDNYEHRGDTFRALAGALAPTGRGDRA